LRYRLTVKGKVTVAAFFIVIAVFSGSCYLGNSKARDADIVREPVSAASSAVEDAAKRNTPKTHLNETSKQSVTQPIKTHARILFEPNQWGLSPIEAEKLSPVVVSAVKNPRAIVHVIGHINGYPDFKINDYGRMLSSKRAQIVADYLIQKGIASNRIQVESRNSDEPVLGSQTMDQLWQNRRTEVFFSEP